MPTAVSSVLIASAGKRSTEFESLLTRLQEERKLPTEDSLDLNEIRYFGVDTPDESDELALTNLSCEPTNEIASSNADVIIIDAESFGSFYLHMLLATEILNYEVPGRIHLVYIDPTTDEPKVTRDFNEASDDLFA